MSAEVKNELLDVAAVAALCGMHPNTVLRWGRTKANRFPRPVRIEPSAATGWRPAKRWRAAEVRQWLNRSLHWGF